VGRTVLIVEDDKSGAKLLTDLLESEGYQVLVEADGEWGLRTFQHKDVDLVVCDVLLPKLVGFDLVDQIRKLDKGVMTPVIMISGVYRAAAHQQKLVDRYAITGYFDKPLELERFTDLVKSALPLLRTSEAPSDPGRLFRNTQRISIADFEQHSPAELEALMNTSNLPVPRRGDLSELPFARLLGQLYSVRATGALMLKRGSVKKIVYLRQGVPIFVKSNILGECLGQIMVKERLISQAQCDKSVERLKTEKKQQGQILITMGAISPQNLAFGLERQLDTKLYDIFSWLDGKYLFNDKEEHKGEAVALALSPAEMVFEGVRRTMSVDRVKKELARIGDRIPIPSNDPTFRYQALELNPGAERLLDALDGRIRMSDLLESNLMPTEHSAVLMYALVSTALVRLLDAPALPSRPSRPASVIPLGDADVEVLSTGEVPIDPDSLGGPIRSAITEVPDAAPLLAQPEPLEISVDAVERAIPVVMGRPSSPARALELVEPMSTSVRDAVRARLEASLTAQLAARSPLEAALPAVALGPLAPARPSQSRIPVPKPEVEKKRLDELLALKTQLVSLDAYARLELDPGATTDDIEAAFDDMSRAHHPDRTLTTSAPREVRALAEEVHLLYVRARDILMSSEQRRDLDRRREPAEDPHRIEARMTAGESAYQEGMRYLDLGELMKAYDAFERATALAPKEGVYLAHQAWTSFMLGDGDREVTDRALAELTTAMEQSPRAEEAHVFAGLIHEKRGDKEEAARCFRRALLANPDSVRTLRALRGLTPAPEKKSGFFGMFSS